MKDQDKKIIEAFSEKNWNEMLDLIPEIYCYQNDWRDVGDWEKYQTVQKQFDSASMLKTNEFIYFINNRVLKFYADSSITANLSSPQDMPILQYLVWT